MSYFYDLKEIGRKELAPGVTVKLVWGDKIMISMIEMAPFAIVPVHSHSNEQAGMVLHGEFDFTIGGETKRLGPGQGWVIPGGVEHSVQGLDGWSLAMDLFSPPREEYKKLVLDYFAGETGS